MKESVAVALYCKELNKIGDTFEQKKHDELQFYWDSLQLSITDWDMKHKREAEQKEKYQRQQDQKNAKKIEHEVFKGRKSTDFSEENWKNFKQGKPLKLLDIFKPKRLNARNSVELWDRKVYLVKKTADYQASKLYHAYDLETGIQLAVDYDKQNLIKFVKQKILEEEDLIDEFATKK